MGSKNLWADWAQILFGGRSPWHNHAIQIWWRSVQWFGVGWGSNFAFSHILWRLSLQHTLSCEVWFYADRRRWVRAVTRRSQLLIQEHVSECIITIVGASRITLQSQGLTALTLAWQLYSTTSDVIVNLTNVVKWKTIQLSMIRFWNTEPNLFELCLKNWNVFINKVFFLKYLIVLYAPIYSNNW